MKRDDLPTVGYLDECFRIILGHIEAIKRPAPAEEAATAVLLTIEQVMERLEVSRSTVQRWIKTGKEIRVGSKRQMLRLPALWFTTTEPRIPWPALLAFGRGEPYDLAQLPAPQPLTVLPARPGVELPAMRLAS